MQHLLKDGDVILVAGFRRHRFGTVSGYAAKYGEGPDVQRDRIAKAVERGHKLVWLNPEATVIAADPSTVDRSFVAEVTPGDEIIVESAHAEERGIYRVDQPGRMDGDHCQLVKVRELDHADRVGPVFEYSTSPLYYSNDGRLHVERVGAVFIVTDECADGETALTTHNRTIADAYIAGYDLATDTTGGNR